MHRYFRPFFRGRSLTLSRYIRTLQPAPTESLASVPMRAFTNRCQLLYPSETASAPHGGQHKGSVPLYHQYPWWSIPSAFSCGLSSHPIFTIFWRVGSSAGVSVRREHLEQQTSTAGTAHSSTPLAGSCGWPLRRECIPNHCTRRIRRSKGAMRKG